MKETGIIRRIDDLGRIVIPKDIRRPLRLREGDAMEIYLDGDAIVLKRYSAMDSINFDVARAAVRAIRGLGFDNAVVYDRYNVVYASCGTMSMPSITPVEANEFSHIRKLSVLDETKDLWVYPILVLGENQGYVVGSQASEITGERARSATVSAVLAIISMITGIAEQRSDCE